MPSSSSSSLFKRSLIVTISEVEEEGEIASIDWEPLLVNLYVGDDSDDRGVR